jgi:hypothetical protein
VPEPVAAPALPADVLAALPTFLIIGAAKTGTTSLHRYLDEHPEIAMSTEKEPMCFESANWTERMAEYRELFLFDARVRGEASTAYGAFPWVPEIPDRVRSLVPDAKIVYVVREPIERMISHYAQNVWDRFPVRPFDELMDDLEDPMNMPVWCSRYATQFERWAERFGDENLLVLDHRELERNRGATVRRVFEFLGVDADFTSPRWDARHNTAGQHVRQTQLGERVERRLPRLYPHLARLPGVRERLAAPVPKPTLKPAQRERVVSLFAPEAARLRKLTGLQFDYWSV